MKTGKKIAALTLVLMMAFTLMPAAGLAAAKKTKTIYVVSSVKIKYGKKTINSKISYKDGFLTKINTPGDIRSFSYDKKYQLKKSTDKITSGDFKGTETRSYSWKNGNIVKIVISNSRSSDEKDTTTYKYNKKDQVISSTRTSEWLNEDGNPGKDVTKSTYSYNKKGYLKSIKAETKNGSDVHITSVSYQSDKKNNIVKSSMDLDGKPFHNSYYKAKISYKNGRVSSMKTEHLIPMGMDGKPAKLTISLKYKKVNVKTSYSDRIADQQWQLINQAAGLIGPHNGVEGFAY